MGEMWDSLKPMFLELAKLAFYDGVNAGRTIPIDNWYGDAEIMAEIYVLKAEKAKSDD